jgi:hypothetical protein
MLPRGLNFWFPSWSLGTYVPNPFLLENYSNVHPLRYSRLMN